MISWTFVEKYKNKPVPWGAVGYVTYKRTYARMTDSGRTEEWWQTLHRCIKSLVEDLDMWMTQAEVEDLYHYCFTLKCSLSGRALWSLGTPTIRKVGADSLQNCWHVAVDHPIEPFLFTFNELMLGGGVGFNIKPEYVYSLPEIRYNPDVQRVDDNDVDLIVADNREGWVELLKRVLESFYYTGNRVHYATHCIRERGSKINGFGGVASGAEELVIGIQNIVNVLRTRFGKKLRPVDCLDIQNIIGSIVVAGNVRRSAEIAIGSADDLLFLNSKAFGRGSIPNWRAMSNNTVDTNDLRELPQLFWDNYTEVDRHGDAVSECFGLINLHNCRTYGRLADGEDYRPDPLVVGTNPCGEISLESYEACNLAEIFLPNIQDEEEFIEVSRIIYKVVKTISRHRFSHPRTREVVERNRRLGIGVTGFLQAGHLKSESIFNAAYRAIEEEDISYSAALGINRSIKLTTVKPSGTLSLLAGVTPGGHPAFSKYMIRRIRFAANDPLVDRCRANGFHVEPKLELDGSNDYNTMVVSFPIATPKGTLTESDVSGINQLEYQKWLQTHWADNSVSTTVYYSDNELPSIRAWLERNYPDNVKTSSLLRAKKHGFKQAPFEAITQERYNELCSKSKPITSIDDDTEREIDSVECSAGGCPIK